MQLKRTKESITDTKNLALSIQFSLDGFSFCIENTRVEKTVFFTEYRFEKSVSSPEDLMPLIEPLFTSDKYLQYDFTKIKVYYKNDLFTLVPNEFFNADELASYLKYSVKTFSTDLIAFDDIDSLDAKLVYIPYVNLNNFVFQNFGEFEFNHFQTLLIDKLINLQSDHEIVMYADLEGSLLSLIVLNGKELLLCNSFKVTSATDSLYYILFAAEQLNIKNTELKLRLMGTIAKGNETHTLLQKYIGDIEFLGAENPIYKSIDLDTHNHFALLHS